MADSLPDSSARSSGAEYRAGLVKDCIDGLAALGEERAAQVRAQISETSLATIARAARTSWLDAELIMEIDRALVIVIGRAAFEQFWTDFAGHPTRIPIVRPLAAAALRLLGSPRGVLKALSMAYSHMTRGLGTYSLEMHGDNHAITRIDGVSLSSFELFALANRASLIGTMTMVGAVAKVELTFQEGPPGWIQFDVRW